MAPTHRFLLSGLILIRPFASSTGTRYKLIDVTSLTCPVDLGELHTFGKREMFSLNGNYKGVTHHLREEKRQIICCLSLLGLI